MTVPFLNGMLQAIAAMLAAIVLEHTVKNLACGRFLHLMGGLWQLLSRFLLYLHAPYAIVLHSLLMACYLLECFWLLSDVDAFCFNYIWFLRARLHP